ncbi:MAG: cytochrome c [Limisphaerales bacterium]
MQPKTRWFVIIIHSLLLVASGWLLSGCATLGAGGSDPSARGGGAQIWAQNCMRCHNIRSPSPYSDAQWSVITMHMRVRANLTADEQRAILKFLQAAN